jgi:acyl carrier protein
VELGEIASAMLTQPSVEQATVIVRTHDHDDRLVAYYTSHDQALDAETLRSHLADVLPSYMVPAAFVRVHAIPLTPNGKVDRSALPAPDASAYAASAYEAPRGDVEIALAEIWAKLLGVERIGRCDNFFDLGGHSLLAMRVVGAVRRELKVELALGDLFTHPALDELADHVIMMQLEQFDPNELRRLVDEGGEKQLTARANSEAF